MGQLTGRNTAQLEAELDSIADKAAIDLSNLASYTTGVDDPSPNTLTGKIYKLDGVLTTSDGTSHLPYVRLNSNGDLVGQIVPRTDTLDQLLLVVGDEGEIASVTDQPAIVKFTGNGEAGGDVLSTVRTQKTVAPPGGAYTIKPDADHIILDLSNTNVTSFNIEPGYVEGQILSIQCTSDTAGHYATAKNSEGADIVVIYTDAMIGLGKPFDFAFTDGEWTLAVGPASLTRNLSVTGAGTVNTGVASVTAGVQCKNLGAHSVALGAGNLIGGNHSVSLATVGSCEMAIPWGYMSGNLTGTIDGTTITIPFTLETSLAVGDEVLLANDYTFDSFYEGVIATINPGVDFTVTVSAEDAAKFSPTFLRILSKDAASSPDLTLMTGLSPFASVEGQVAHGWQGSPSTVSVKAGALQTTVTRLVARTTDATPTLMLSNTGSRPYHANSTGLIGIITLPPDSIYKQFVTAQGKHYEIEVLFIAKIGSLTVADSAKFKRSFAVFNNGGVQSITAIDTVGTDRKSGALAALAEPVITVNDTTQTIDFTVTGIASTAIGWVAEITAIEIMMK